MAVARVTELVASSPKGFSEALQEGFSRAKNTLRGITDIEIVSQNAIVEKNEIKEYRVRIKVTFILET